jgi:hypothetical protein
MLTENNIFSNAISVYYENPMVDQHNKGVEVTPTYPIIFNAIWVPALNNLHCI